MRCGCDCVKDSIILLFSLLVGLVCLIVFWPYTKWLEHRKRQQEKWEEEQLLKRLSNHREAMKLLRTIWKKEVNLKEKQIGGFKHEKIAVNLWRKGSHDRARSVQQQINELKDQVNTIVYILEEAEKCTNCGKKWVPFRCKGSCNGRAKYCSVACQRENWRVHKIVCKKVKRKANF